MNGIVVVGGSSAVQAHAERYGQWDDADVSGVVITDGESESLTDATRYDSLEHALSEVDGDAVDVCGPGFVHAETVHAALDADVPVRCDPPFALSTDRFDRVVSAAECSDGWVMADSPHRFSRLYGRLRSSVETGGIGDVGVARVVRSAPYDGAGWNVSYAGVRSAETATDTLCAVVAHDIDVFEWTFGPIERVFARGRDGGRCDHVHAMFTFRDGGRATVETTWCANAPPTPRVEVEYSGSHGRLDFDDADAKSAVREDGETLAVDPPDDECRGRALRAFVDAVGRSERTPPLAVEPTTPSRVATALRRSVADERPVRVGEESP